MVGRTSRVTKAPTRFQDDDDFYLIKFVEDNVRIVLSSDKVKIKDEDVEAGSACEAYWEDTQIKGWFPAIILAFGDSYENLLKLKNQKKRNSENQAEPESKKAKKMSSQPKRSSQGKVQKSKEHPEKETEEDENEKKRKEQEREAKKRKREEEKKKREAKQQQRKEQLLTLQKHHNNLSQQQLFRDEEPSDSDDNYQPTALDESSSSESEEEEEINMARKHASKGRVPLQTLLANPGCSPSHHLGRSSSSNVNRHPRSAPPTNPGRTSSPLINARQTSSPANSTAPCHTLFRSANSNRMSLPANPRYTQSSPVSPDSLSPSVFPRRAPSPLASPDLTSSSFTPRHTPSPPASPDLTSSSFIPRHTPSTPASPDCESPSISPDHTPSHPARHDRMPTSVSTCHTPSPPATSRNISEEVDWQEEYRKLCVKYNALKEKVRILEQSTQREYTSEEKPPPGIYSESDAQKYKMVEVYKGSGVFWYLGNRHSALNSTKTAGELTAYLMDTFFSKETMAASNMNGRGKKGYQKLNPTIINVMRGFVLDDSHYGKQAGIIFNKTVQDKCCGARRGVSKGLTD